MSPGFSKALSIPRELLLSKSPGGEGAGSDNGVPAQLSHFGAVPRSCSMRPWVGRSEPVPTARGGSPGQGSAHSPAPPKQQELLREDRWHSHLLSVPGLRQATLGVPPVTPGSYATHAPSRAQLCSSGKVTAAVAVLSFALKLGCHSYQPPSLEQRAQCCFLNLLFLAPAGVAQWTEHWPANQRVTSLIPSQGTGLGCGSGQQSSGGHMRGNHTLMFLSLFLLPLSKKE